jgi:hypothetical protein
MDVIVIIFQDVRIEGVEAVLAIPKGKTAEQVYKKWLKVEAKNRKADGDDPDMDVLRETYAKEAKALAKVSRSASPTPS